MNAANLTHVVELQNASAQVYAAARSAFEAAKTAPELQQTVLKQHAAADSYRNAANAREAALAS
jgi:hypothetical protein